VGEFHFDVPAIGHREFPVWAEFLPDQAQGMLLPQYIHEGKPYPVKAVLGVGMNHMMWPDSSYMLSALKKLDYFVAVDLFMTETARYADIVLPACSGLERSDVKIFADGYVQCFPPAIEPLGESRHDIQILLDLARALGLQDPHLRMTYEEYMDFILEPTGLKVREIQANGGIMKTKNTLPPYREKKYRDGGFHTPSGKVELVSSVVARYAADYGLDPLPEYRSCAQLFPQYCGPEYPLLMNTGARRPQYMHTRTYRMRWLAELEPNDLLDIHPEDAARYGLTDGGRVRITTPAGSICATVHCTATVHPGAVHMYHGNERANTSYLMAHDYLDPYSGYPGYKSFPCRVEAVTEE
ncbi:MAG: molybdopterin-dependent oxidoreductase, partial [Oscillospiraceae bacterium]|nr:molybdopterin-dependent oxidoreductase [Oscillospiraceae bacterium]